MLAALQRQVALCGFDMHFHVLGAISEHGILP